MNVGFGQSCTVRQYQLVNLIRSRCYVPVSQNLRGEREYNFNEGKIEQGKFQTCIYFAYSYSLEYVVFVFVFVFILNIFYSGIEYSEIGLGVDITLSKRGMFFIQIVNIKEDITM